ncbi:hypothetical protein [uncultured Roseibium sp.]|uniref:hypothetical protein n=1 Tax=uncultured Roseibium sp. TaxID=1936171 RepID=UPI003216A2EA
MLARFFILNFFLILFAGLGVFEASAKTLKASNSEIAAFLKADVNKDKVLSKREFRTFIRALADFGQSTAKKIRFFGVYGYAFSVVDKNKDGIVTPQEMRSADDDFKKGK